ncbi:MAG: tetratricopeptide repeat protein, partial [Acetobacteraceae bacterium]
EMFVTGQGGPRDHKEALRLYRKAARRGHVGAMFAVGALLGGGHDIAPDRNRAARWYRAAAERGHGQAQLMLGRYFLNGTAGVRDPAEARSWLERAAAQGLAEASSFLAELPPPVPTDQASLQGTRI